MVSESKTRLIFSSRFIILWLAIFFCLSNVAGQTTAISNNSSQLSDSAISDVEKQKVFDNLWETVSKKYFDAKFGGVDWNRVRETYRPQAIAAKNKYELLAVLRNAVGKIGNPHLTVSLIAKIKGKRFEAIFGKDLDTKKNDILLGYGFQTRRIEDKWIVTKVDSGSSAYQKGVKVGWSVVRLRDAPVDGKVLAQTGEEGEEAKFEFIDENGRKINLVLILKFYLLPRPGLERTAVVLDNGTLYLKFPDFSPGTGDWFKNELKKNFNSPAVIIDLRNNSGGLFSILKTALASFFPAGTKIGEFTQRDGDDNNLSVGVGERYQGKVVVLTNENSFSSAEIFAAALQESGRAKIVGQKTFGAVLYSVDKDLSAGFIMRIGLRDYKTVKGVRLEGKGVLPDYIVPLTLEDFLQNRDRDLETALRILKEL